MGPEAGLTSHEQQCTGLQLARMISMTEWDFSLTGVRDPKHIYKKPQVIYDGCWELGSASFCGAPEFVEFVGSHLQGNANPLNTILNVNAIPTYVVPSGSNAAAPAPIASTASATAGRRLQQVRCRPCIKGEVLINHMHMPFKSRLLALSRHDQANQQSVLVCDSTQWALPGLCVGCKCQLPFCQCRPCKMHQDRKTLCEMKCRTHLTGSSIGISRASTPIGTTV